MSALPHLQKQLRELQSHPLGGFRVEVEEDLYRWTVWFSGPQDTPYFPGQYRAQLSFPKDFPMEPPTFRILSSFWHPNVYTDGKVCISILHPPGVDDMNSEETAMMRWTPIQTIRSVLLSVISLLSDPDPKEAGAPANVDALVQYRKDRLAYNERCQQLAKKSLDELPPEFEPPQTNEDIPPPYSGFTQESCLMQSLTYDDDYDDEKDYFDDDGEEACHSSTHPVEHRGRESGGVAGSTISPAERYAAELEMIRDMNLKQNISDSTLIALLQEHKGEIVTVMDKINEMQ